jgi:peptide/nickel transport system permease protein
MLVFTLKRLGQAFIAIIVISMLVFWILYKHADPVATLLPPFASQSQREALRKGMGLDRPLHIQYFTYLGNLLKGDLGISYYQNRPVVELLKERAPATFELAVISILFSTIIGVPLGALCASKSESVLSRCVMGGSLFGISVPTFWLGLILMMIFGVWLNWLPAQGRGSGVELAGIEWSWLTLDGWAHLLLPAVTLALYHLAMLMRIVRAEMTGILNQPFIRACRARGIAETRVVGIHAARNMLIPVITIVGMQLGGLVAFSVVTETIFQWPGLGKLLIDSINVIDRPVIVAYLMLTGLCFLALNFLVDVTYAWIDPRIRWTQTEA